MNPGITHRPPAFHNVAAFNDVGGSPGDRHQPSILPNHQISVERRTLISRHRKDSRIVDNQLCRSLRDPARYAPGK